MFCLLLLLNRPDILVDFPHLIAHIANHNYKQPCINPHKHKWHRPLPIDPNPTSPQIHRILISPERHPGYRPTPGSQITINTAPCALNTTGEHQQPINGIPIGDQPIDLVSEVAADAVHVVELDGLAVIEWVLDGARGTGLADREGEVARKRAIADQVVPQVQLQVLPDRGRIAVEVAAIGHEVPDAGVVGEPDGERRGSHVGAIQDQAQDRVPGGPDPGVQVQLQFGQVGHHVS